MLLSSAGLIACAHPAVDGHALSQINPSDFRRQGRAPSLNKNLSQLKYNLDGTVYNNKTLPSARLVDPACRELTINILVIFVTWFGWVQGCRVILPRPDNK